MYPPPLSNREIADDRKATDAGLEQADTPEVLLEKVRRKAGSVDRIAGGAGIQLEQVRVGGQSGAAHRPGASDGVGLLIGTLIPGQAFPGPVQTYPNRDCPSRPPPPVAGFPASKAVPVRLLPQRRGAAAPSPRLGARGAAQPAHPG